LSYGIEINAAIGQNDASDLRSFRLFAEEVKTESVTGAAQDFVYTAPSGWNSSNGVFYVVPESDKILPSFTVTGSNEITASFTSFNASFKATSWKLFWLVTNSTDTPSGYGILISNTSGETVVSNDYEVLQTDLEGTLTTYTTTNTGVRQFELPNNFSFENDIVFVKLSDNSDLFFASRNFYTDPLRPRVCSTTETSLDYFLVKKPSTIASSIGYGMEIFNPSGQLSYSSNYNIFPSNGQTLTVKNGASTTIDSNKDVWVSLNFGSPAPFCPDPNRFPTFNLIKGLERSGSTVENSVVSIYDDLSSSAQGSSHDNTALIVQR